MSLSYDEVGRCPIKLVFCAVVGGFSLGYVCVAIPAYHIIGCFSVREYITWCEHGVVKHRALEEAVESSPCV